MKLSNKRMVGDGEKLSEISQKVFPIKVSYAIAKNLGKIETAINLFNVQREKLLDKYSEKDEKGHVELIEETIPDWNREMEELFAIETEVAIHKFPLSDLDIKGLFMTPSEFMVIDYMIEE